MWSVHAQPKTEDRTTRSRRSSKNSTKREQGGRGACEEPAACGRRATKYQYISRTPARVEADKGGGTRASGAGAAAPGASGPTNEEQRDSRTLTRHREEDGRSRRSPRQRRKDRRRTRLRSEATRAKSRDQGRRDKARNPQRSPAEQSKTEGELMQRTTPEAETGERMQQRSGRTRRQPWNPRTTKEEPKACAKETGHGKGAEGKRQALRHPEAGKEIEKNEEPQEESRTKEQREQKRRKSWRSRSHHRSRTHHRQPLTPSADTREGKEEATETVEGAEKGGAGWREAETRATEVRAGTEEATARRAEEKTPEAEKQAREAPDERGG